MPRVEELDIFRGFCGRVRCGALLLLAGTALLCIPLSSPHGKEPEENPFDQFDVGWEDSCPSADDDSWCKFTISITGEITPGTVTRFEKALARADGRQHLLITLDSRGGDLASAMKIGRSLRNARGRTSVGRDATCASACVLIFAAGLSRVVDQLDFSGLLPLSPPTAGADPSMTMLGHIGIHRPALAGTPQQNDMPGVKAAADEAERELREYAAEMNLSPRLIDDMLATPPEQVRWLSENDLKNYGLGFLDPVYAETVSILEAKKYNISPNEYRRRNANALLACKKLLNDDDRYGFLESPHRSQCVVDIISGKLTPPAGFVAVPEVK